MKVNPEVFRGQGLGDSFEWNRADSSCFLRAGAGGLVGAIVPAAAITSAAARGIVPWLPTFRRKKEKKEIIGKNCTSKLLQGSKFELRGIFAKFNNLKPEIL